MSERTPPTTGAHHLSRLAREDRRAHGKVYTSASLARFVLAQAVPEGERILGPVLDPAVGAGVFLLAALDRIAREENLTTVKGRRRVLERARADLWGLDTDPVAVELARKGLSAALEGVVGTPVDQSTFDDNIVVADFLSDDLSVFPRLTEPPRLLVGNPPYVAADRIEAERKALYRTQFSTAYGRLDLYTLFMEQATRMLSPGGSFAFITPDKYLSSSSARPLREHLRHEGDVRGIAVFTSHRVFDDAATVPCITVWSSRATAAERPAPRFAVSRVGLGLDTERTPSVEEVQVLDPIRLRAPTWSFQRGNHDSLEKRLTTGHGLLGEQTERISAGLTTGYNPAFILDPKTAARLEPQVVHRTVRGRDVQADEILDRGEFMLVPYEWDADGQPHLIDLAAYPKTRRWLGSFRMQLQQRHCVRVWGKAWWDLHDPVGSPLHETPKILVPDVARSNRFAADPGQYVPQHSVYYLTTSSIPTDTLVAILNSPEIEFLVRTRAPLVKDGFSRYRRQFLRELPIPEVPVDTQRAIQRARAARRDDEVAGLISALFGVETGEVEHALASIGTSNSRRSRVIAGTGRVPQEGGASPK